MNQKNIIKEIDNIKKKPEFSASSFKDNTGDTYKSGIKNTGLIFILSAISKMPDINSTLPSLSYPYRVLKWGIENLPKPYSELVMTLRKQNNVRWWYEISLNKAPESKVFDSSPSDDSHIVKAFEWLFNEQQKPNEDNLKSANLILSRFEEITSWETAMRDKFHLTEESTNTPEIIKNTPNISINEQLFSVTTKNKYYYLSFPFDSKIVFCVRMIGNWIKKDKSWKIPRNTHNSEHIAFIIEMIKESIEKEKIKTNNLVLEEKDDPIVGVHGKIKIVLLNNNFHISFPYSKNTVNLIKEISNKKYEKSSRTWIIPISSRNELIVFIKKATQL